GEAVAVDVARGRNAPGADARVPTALRVAAARVAVFDEIVAFEPVRRPAQGEVVAALVRAAAVDGADDPVAVRGVPVVRDEDDLGEIELVDATVAVVVVEIDHDGGGRDLIRPAEGAAGRIRGFAVLATPAELELRQDLLERRRGQRAARLDPRPDASPGFAGRVLRTIPVVFAGAPRRRARLLRTLALEIAGASTGIGPLVRAAVGRADEHLVAVALPGVRLAHVVNALFPIAEARGAALHVGFARDAHAVVPAAWGRLTLLELGAVEIVARVVDTARLVAVDLAPLSRAAREPVARIGGRAAARVSRPSHHAADGDHHTALTRADNGRTASRPRVPSRRVGRRRKNHFRIVVTRRKHGRLEEPCRGRAPTESHGPWMYLIKFSAS